MSITQIIFVSTTGCKNANFGILCILERVNVILVVKTYQIIKKIVIVLSMTTLYAFLLHLVYFLSYKKTKQKKTINKCNNPVIIFLQQKTRTNQKTNKWIKILQVRHDVINMTSQK